MADAKTLLAEADVSAERLIAVIRMLIAVLLGAAFVFLSLMRADAPDSAVEYRQVLLVGGTIAAYFLLGAAAWTVVRKGLFRPWLAWAFAGCDVAFLIAGTLFSLINTDLAGGFAFMVPSIWLIPLVLAFGSLRYRPALQVAMTAAVTTWLLAMMVWVGGWEEAMTPERAHAVMRAHGPAPTAMRLAMIVLAGLALAIAVGRARRLLVVAIEETRRRANLTRFLPAQLAASLSDAGLATLRKGRLVEAAVMFVDMRDFTAWAENRSSEAVSEFLTAYRKRVSRAVAAHDGLIDKFIGDGALVVFGAMRAQPDFAAHAVGAGVEILGSIARWNERRAADGEAPIAVGVGIHVGEVFIGALGDRSRLEFTVLGNVVNIAARLEELTRIEGYPLIISRDLAARAGVEVVPPEWIELGERTLFGQKTPISLVARGPRYEVPASANAATDPSSG